MKKRPQSPWSIQNWSADGMEANRKAALIIFNEDARPLEAIFLHDWVNMAAAKVSL
jgi:hypothetical protein